MEQVNGVIQQLYDARGDPREVRDRARDDPEALERLSGLPDAYLELRPEWGEAPTRAIGELELNQLRALGYALP